MPNGCPSRGAVVASMVIAVRGSICQRSPGSWEPRVFVGVDPTTKRLCYRSTTIRGNRADAQRQLDAMVASIRAKNAVGLRSRATCWGRDSRSIVTVAPELTPPTAAFTGARRAQLLGLPWRNIDLERGRISFCAGWVEGPHGSVLTDTKTKRRHSVDLDPGCIDVLAEYAECCRARGSLQSPDGFVFSDTTETPHGNRTASRKRSSACDAKLVCASFGFTTFRHFMATQMLDAGVPLAVVSRRLDHRRFSTTLDRYAHAVPGGDAVAAQTLWRIVVQAG